MLPNPTFEHCSDCGMPGLDGWEFCDECKTPTCDMCLTLFGDDLLCKECATY